LLGPPSTRYDATVNGAPANPISGVPPSCVTNSWTDSVRNDTSDGSTGRIPARSSSDLTGDAITGPTPGLISRSTPTAFSGVTMSE
jgi:hypothetical protein